MARRKRPGRKRRTMAHRDPNGQITRKHRIKTVELSRGKRDEDGKEIDPNDFGEPSRENVGRREEVFGSRTAQGELDCVIDVLAGAKCRLITEKQAEAGRRYSMARTFALRAAGINPGPAGAALSEWIDSPRTPPDVPDDGKSAYRWRKARQAVHDAGADVRRIVDQVCVDNVPPRTHQVERLRIGLDSLIRLWRL